MFASIGAILTAISVVSSVVSMAMAFSARGKGGIEGMGDQGSNVNRRGTDNPSIVAFGNSIVPAAKVFANVNNSNRRWLTEVFSLGHGPLKEVNQLFIDEQPLFAGYNDHSEIWSRSDSFNSGFINLQVGVRRGNPNNSTWGQIIQHGDGLWTDSHRGDGIGTVSFLIERPNMKGKSDNPYRVMNPNFQLSAQVQGVGVIDPRLDPSLQGWNDRTKRIWGNSYRNPALCLLTYLADNEWGFGLKPDMVDLPAFSLLANWCDQNGITLDGYIDQSQTYGKILDAFSSAFNGFIYIHNGMISVIPDTVSPVRFNVTESDLFGKIDVSNNAAQYYNAVKVDFQNERTKYCKDTFVLPANTKADPTINKDGRIFEQTIECPLSTNPEYIRRIANQELKRAKLCRKGITLTLSNQKFDLQIGRVFTVENGLYDLNKSTKWRIIKLENTLDDKTLLTTVTAEQYDERVYDTTSYADGNLSTDQPRPDLIILPVTDLEFQQNASLQTGSGTLNFNSNYFGECRFAVQYRLSGTSNWTQYGEYPFESVMIQGLQTGRAYDFRVQVISAFGGSMWTVLLNQMINRTINLPAVSNLQANFTTQDCVITFDALSGDIPNDSPVADGITDITQAVNFYRIDINGKTYQTKTNRLVYSFDDNLRDGLNRKLTIQVTPISIWGDVGLPADTTAYNAPMDQPSGVSVLSELINLTVQWDNPSSVVPDYRITNVYLKSQMSEDLDSSKHYIGCSATGNFTTMLDGAKNGWIVCEHVDVFGSATPIIGSSPIYFEMNSIDDLLTDSNNFNTVLDNITEIKKELNEQGGEIIELQDKVQLHDTSITENKTLIETANSKLAQVETEVATQGAKITETAQVVSDLDGTVNALKTIKLDVNNKVSGLILGNNGETSTFDVIADVFRVSHDQDSQAVFEIKDGKTIIRTVLISDLTAQNIRAGSITGNEINSLSIIRAGSGNTSATLDGSNSTWRLYAGNTNPDLAPFRVNTSGGLFATQADITGKITATSGSFSGSITAQSGSIAGRLNVGSSYISGVGSDNFLQGENARFVVDRAGNMTCQYAVINGGYFRGQVSIENLVGDVYRKDVYALPIRGVVNIPGHHQQVNFFVANIGSQNFAQRVIFSSIDVPFTLRDQGGKGDLYYQIGGLAPVWIGNIEGPSGAKKPNFLNYHVHVPAGQSQIRFYLVPYNNFAFSRGAVEAGVIETMKWQTVGVSVGDGW